MGQYRSYKINIHDLNSQLAELNEELEKENQKVNQELKKDINYPLRKKLIEKLPSDKRENNNFVSELIELFLKLNKDIPDWSLREDERRKARKDIIDEKTKKYFGKKMLQKERKELISLLENYFLSEYYSSIKSI